MKFLNETLIPFLNNGIFIYALVISLSYLILAYISSRSLQNYIHRTRYIRFDQHVSSPLAPRVSIIAPAYNEGLTVIENVKSLISLRYVNFEVIIVNDGSKDDTIDKLISSFALVATNYYYEEKVPCKPIRGIYRSTNPVYNKLWVIDKENGGKADALNSGMNLASGTYAACIDVDCVLEPDSILRMVKPMMEAGKKRVIASGGVVRIANQCEIKNGRLVKINLPDNRMALFQVVEYLRVFMLGRLAWARIDGLLLISGAFGLFDKEIVIEAGGYDHSTVGEDMELVVRMRRLMCEQKRPYAVTFIPDPLCWTEAPESMTILSRQRNRWTRGTIETLRAHKVMFFNPKYKLLGMISFPYWFFFEWLAPLIEASGLLYSLILLITGHLNVTFFLLLVLLVYSFALSISFYAIQTDLKTYDMYKNKSDQFRMMGVAMVEPFFFHMFNVLNALKGNRDYIMGKKSWGAMTRTGFSKPSK